MIDRHFKVNTFITYGANAIVMGSGFVLMFIINRYAGVDVYGKLALIVSSAGIITSLLSARSGEAVTRFFVREKTLGNKPNAKLIVLIGLFVDISLGLVLFFVFYFLSDTIATVLLHEPELSFSVWIYGFITFFTFIRGSMMGYFQSHEYFRVINSIQVLEAILKVFFLVISFFILHKMDIKYIIYSYIIASFLVSLYIVVIFGKRFLKEFKGIKIEKNIILIKEYFNFNFKTFVSTFMASFSSGVDNLFLGYYTDTNTVGIYQVLKNIFVPTSFISSPFVMMTVSKLTKYFSQSNINMFIILIKKITLFVLLSNVFIIILLYINLNLILDILNIHRVITLEFILLALSILMKRAIWWNKIVMDLYNPLIIGYQSLASFLIFVGFILFISFFVKVSFIHILLSVLISSAIITIISFTILSKFIRLYK